MTKTKYRKTDAADITQRIVRDVASPALHQSEQESLAAKKAESQILLERLTNSKDTKAMSIWHGYAKTSQLMNRWQVDRQTARAAVCHAGIVPSTIHKSPHFSWFDVLEKVEGWPHKLIARIDTATSLHRTSDLADLLSVSFPTIRNYGKSGRLHEVRLGKRTLRYAFPDDLLDQSEGKSVGYGKM